MRIVGEYVIEWRRGSGMRVASRRRLYYTYLEAECISILALIILAIGIKISKYL